MLVLACQRVDDHIVECEQNLHEAGRAIEFRSVPDAFSVLAWLARGPFYKNEKLFPKPDLIITEFKTDNGDGLDIVRWVRKSKQHCSMPIIILADGTPKEFREAQRLGADVCLPHDVNPQILCECIGRLLRL